MCLAVLGVTPSARADERPTGTALPLATRALAPEASGAPATVDAAMEAGDLTTARSLATAQREANPSPANFETEAKVLEASGHYGEAQAAYEGQLAALPKDASAQRETVQANIARMQNEARGTVAGEPESTNRKDLDARWAPPKPTKKKKRKKKVVPPPAADVRDDRVVDKWYFWVTLGAIAASAAAVTAIAIRASRQDQPDALGLQRTPSRGPTMLRF